MIVYAWKFTAYDDPAEPSMKDYLQFSVQRQDIDQFCGLVVDNEKELSIDTTSLPINSPHHLDSENHVISDPREEFQRITLHKTSIGPYPLVVALKERMMNISYTNEGRDLMVASLQKSKVFGYFSDNNLDILIKDENRDSRVSKLIVWAASENGIVYY